MRLYERDIHDALLDRLTGETLAGHGQVLVLEGVPTAGRTALLSRAVERAERAGMLALRATCSPMERELDASVLTQLLHSVAVSEELAGLAVPNHHEFCVRIRNLAAGRPLLVAVDDVHDADERSVRSLLYLARRVDAARVLIVLTCERAGLRTVPTFVDALLDEPRVHQQAVEPLSVAGTAQWLAEELGGDDAGLADEFHRMSRGNPGLLRALIDDHTAAEPANAVATSDYGTTVVRLLRRGDAVTMRVARAVAVLGTRGTPDRVARLAGLDRESGVGEVVRALAAMNAIGFLRSGEIPHPAGRMAVLGTVTGPERTPLNQQAAELLHADGEPVTAIACHLVQAGRLVEPWAVPVLVEAADHLLLAGRDERAERYLELAAESCQRPAERAPVLAKYTTAVWARNPTLAARNLTQLASAARVGQLDRGAAADLVRQLLWHGRVADAAMVVDWLRGAGDADAVTVRSLESWLAFTHPPLTTPARTWSPGAPQDAVPPAGGDPGLVSAASMAELLRRRHAGRRNHDHVCDFERALHHLRSSGGDTWVRETCALALLGLLSADRPDLVVDWCARLTTPSDAHRAPARHAEVGSMRAEALLRRGDLLGALAGAREALSLMPARAWGVVVGFPLGTLVTAAVQSGNLAEAAHHLAFAPPEAMFRTRYGLYYLYARGEYHLATKRTYAAIADFAACGDLVRLLGLEAAATVPWRAGAALAWLALGNENRARRLVRDELSRVDAAGARERGRVLRVLAAVSRPERRPALLQESVELFEECGDQYGQAQALTDLGRAFSALDDGRRARAMLRRARHLAALCGAAPLCDELLAILAPGDIPAALGEEGTERLTDSEWRVAHLAVLGYTNREIAAKLYVTSSTVEQHLTRVFRKLDVKRRKDLPADLGTSATRSQLGSQPASAR